MWSTSGGRGRKRGNARGGQVVHKPGRGRCRRHVSAFGRVYSHQCVQNVGAMAGGWGRKRGRRGGRRVGRRVGRGGGSVGKRGWLNIVGVVRVGLCVGERGAGEAERRGVVGEADERWECARTETHRG